MNAFNKVKRWQVWTQKDQKMIAPPPSIYSDAYNRVPIFPKSMMYAQLCTPTLYEVRPSSAHPTVMELDRFQALLQQRAILCRAPLYGRWVRARGIREPNTANINEIGPYGRHTNSHYGAHGSQPRLCSPVVQLRDLKSLRQRDGSPDEASSPPSTTQSLLSRQHTTSNGHHRDEWIFCLVCPQCGLLRLPRIPAE